MISITVHNTGLVDHQMSGLCWYKEVLYVSQLEPSLVRPVRIATLLRCTLQYCILGLSGKYFSSFTSAGNGNIMPCTKLLISLKYLVDLNIRLSRYEKIIELQNSDCLMCLMQVFLSLSEHIRLKIRTSIKYWKGGKKHKNKWIFKIFFKRI